MKILIATDSFKDSLTSIKACKAISTGLKLANPAFETKISPMPDGGRRNS